MRAAVEALHRALGAVLDQVEMEVDKEGLEEGHHCVTVQVTVLGNRTGEKTPQSSKLGVWGCRHYVDSTRFWLGCELGRHLLREMRSVTASSLASGGHLSPRTAGIWGKRHCHLDLLRALNIAAGSCCPTGVP
jgi:hypothetical protein